MTFGTTVITVKTRLKGGPDIICGTVNGVIGDTSLSIDLSSYINTILSATVFVNGVGPDATAIDITTDPSALDITIPDNGYQVEHLGTADMSSGYTGWTGTPESFFVDYNGGGATEVTLDTDTANQGATVTEIDASLTTAGLAASLEAYTTGNFVGIRSVASTSGITFVLSAGSTDALGSLGWTVGSYTNVDLIVANFTVIGR